MGTGMTVDKKTAQFKSDYKGAYYFYSPGCKKAFDREPEKYMKGQPKGMPAKKPWWKIW